ncbi:MAG: response regulator transcription factor [Chloroflexota bacterium]
MTSKIKTLVISGDPAMLKFLQQYLSRDEFEIAITRHTDEGLKTLLDGQSPELIILDIMMPSMEGLEVCLRIRQCSPAPIMMLSAWGASEGRLRGLDLCADGYLTDPFGPPELMNRIDNAMGRNLVANLMPNSRSGTPNAAK